MEGKKIQRANGQRDKDMEENYNSGGERESVCIVARMELIGKFKKIVQSKRRKRDNMQ